MDHQQILDWVNEQRKQYGIGAPLAALPKGIPDQACECVLARALGTTEVPALVDETNTYLRDESLPCSERVFIDTPDFAAQFIRDFDAGVYPELIEEQA